MSILTTTTRIDRRYLSRKSKHELAEIIMANLDRIDLFASPATAPAPPTGSMRQLAEAAVSIAAWLWNEIQTLEDVHAYGQRYGQPGCNVFRLILEDALKFRGITLEQLRSK